MPTRPVPWSEVVSQGLFYSILNYIVFFYPAMFVLRPTNFETHPFWYWGALVLLLLVGPLFLVVFYRQLHRWKLLTKWVQAPYPTSWDSFFDRRQECFVKVYLQNGRIVGGFWGKGSYASSYPHEGDLYIASAIQIEDDGRFGKRIENSAGILIRKEEYMFLEFLHPPDTKKPAKENTNGK
jgi:hypothetical protein